MTKMNLKMTKEIDLEVPSSQDTADRIASEASRLFAIKGFDGVSIKEIGEAAGVTSASVHYHFGTKANLFQQIIEQFVSELLVSARISLLTPRSSEDLKIRLEIFIKHTVEAIIERPDVLSIIRREMERSADVIDKTIFKHLAALIEFLTQAKENGLLADDIVPSFAAEFLIGQITRAREKEPCRRNRLNGWCSDEEFRDQWIRQLLRLFLGGVTRPERRRRSGSQE
jgi:AcrR family transcriptional regulator